MSAPFRHKYSVGDKVYYIDEYCSEPKEYTVHIVNQKYLISTLCDYHLVSDKFGKLCVRNDQEEITLFASYQAAASALKTYKTKRILYRLEKLKEYKEKLFDLNKKTYEELSIIGLEDKNELFFLIDKYTSSPDEHVLKKVVSEINRQL